MPRIAPSVLRQAWRMSRHHTLLLPVCRDLESTANELRWMKEHATSVSRRCGLNRHDHLLESFVLRRARGEPLQYLLGSAFFGDLEIRCRSGVLIPRQETAYSVAHLAKILCEQASVTTTDGSLRVLDLCTGTGCIPLLLHHEFYSKETHPRIDLQLVGVDISAEALSLARENLVHQIAVQGRSAHLDQTRTRSLQNIGFVQADVLKVPSAIDQPGDSLPLLEALERLHADGTQPSYDVLISNPPYISPREFRRTTQRSVRAFEPRLALVPPSREGATDIDTGDQFYPRLVEIARQVKAKVVLFEVADMLQARRVASILLRERRWDSIQIWRDEPGAPSLQEAIMIDGRKVQVCGRGQGRSVFATRGADRGRAEHASLYSTQ